MRSNTHIRPGLRARLTAVLVASLALSSIAAPSATAASCGPDGSAIVGPSSIYIVEGQAISHHVYATDCAAPVTWSAGGDLPTGVSFDPATRSFVGTPTRMHGWFELTAANEHGETTLEGSFEPLDTTVALSGPDQAEIDLNSLAPGDEFTARGSVVPDGSFLEVLWDSTSLTRRPASGVFGINLTVPATATRGPHKVTVAYELPNGQRYTTTHQVNVTDLELSGPAKIYSIVGVHASYTYTGIDASADAEYVLSGELPAGMAFDTETVTISGTPHAATTHPQLVSLHVHNGARSDSLDITIVVTALAALPRPTVTAPQINSLNLARLTELLGSLGDISDTATQRELERLLEELNDEEEEAAQQTRPTIPIGMDPATGEMTIFIGSKVESAKEQARRLEAEAQRAADQAKLDELKALEEERNRRLEAEKLERDEALAHEKQKQLLKLERLKQEKLAQAAKEQAEKAAAKNQALEKARQAFEERQRELQGRTENEPLPEGTQVQLELHSTPVLLGQATVGPTGGFLILASVPPGTVPGNHTLVTTYTLPDGTVHTQSMAVTVLAPNPAILPATGIDNVPIGYAGALFALLGTALIVRARRNTARGVPIG